MKQILVRLATVAVVLAVGTTIGSAQAKVDLTGKWLLSVQTDAGAGNPTFTLKQDGDKLTGHYSGTFGEAEVTGSVKGNDFTIQYSADAQGTKLDITYKGTIENKDSIKGTLSITGVGEGTFTGKRQ
jgi:hypothetical protein